MMQHSNLSPAPSGSIGTPDSSRASTQQGMRERTFSKTPTLTRRSTMTEARSILWVLYRAACALQATSDSMAYPSYLTSATALHMLTKIVEVGVNIDCVQNGSLHSREILTQNSTAASPRPVNPLLSSNSGNNVKVSSLQFDRCFPHGLRTVCCEPASQ